MLGMPRPQAPPVPVARWRGGEWRADGDQVAAEEPLQLLLDGEPLSMVMRTPGNDLELALGLLHAERVLTSAADVSRIIMSAESAGEDPGQGPFPVEATLLEANTVDVRLVAGAPGRRPQ